MATKWTKRGVRCGIPGMVGGNVHRFQSLILGNSSVTPKVTEIVNDEPLDILHFGGTLRKWIRLERDYRILVEIGVSQRSVPQLVVFH